MLETDYIFRNNNFLNTYSSCETALECTPRTFTTPKIKDEMKKFKGLTKAADLSILLAF